MTELWRKKTITRRLKQGQATKKEFRNFAWACKDGVKGANIQLQPELTTDIKSTRASASNLTVKE